MAEFLSTFVFTLPGIMAYFWLQVFGLNPSVKHTASELSAIAALLWLPVSFGTLLVLNTWGVIVSKGPFSVKTAWTLDDVNLATSDIKYLFLFLMVSFLVSFIVSWFWSKIGNELIRALINKVRKSRGIAKMSSSTSVWSEFFIRIDNSVDDSEENESGNEDVSKDHENNKKNKEKIAVYIVHKVDNPKNFVIGSMTKASSPLEIDKGLVLENVQEWTDSLEDYDYKVKKAYIDVKSGMVVKELDYNNPIEKTTPEGIE
ncbi:hypothetical protein SAMN05880501_11689 [Ureibacillus xyleni]|uniref:Uncharacterized protein n=1 Tax=Ureibacillus xyleni TaxID=614648 RepID=A0A285TMW9_9BACL|nr:hypothetical protein [Ureibacillus xyleni]SOC24083.1 hypothetical protein SAMN05880501_11689 [Ureibacillus xyleni]